jgi:hypothetical protein
MKAEMMNRIPLWIQTISGRAPRAIVPFTILVMWAGNGAYSGPAQKPAQPTFPSAADATQRLFEAVQHNDETAINNILGGTTDLTSSRDEGQDKIDRELFVRKYQQMHRLRRNADGSETLYIGAENWPFPVPLVAKNNVWRFDPDAGLKEVLFRRIGENELTAVAISREFIASERRPRAKPNTQESEDVPPETLAAIAASGSTDGKPVLLHGYYFRILPTRPTNRTGQATDGPTIRRSTLIAYPADYRSSGVLTFIAADNGVVYEKDLGPNTSTRASRMAAFRKDATWRVNKE